MNARPLVYSVVGARVVALLLLVSVVGCSNANQPLNSNELPLERRVVNVTRAATFAQVVAPFARSGPAALRSNREIYSADAAQSGGETALPRDADGCFVGLALSGGGSRSANFAAACMFQLERLGLLQKVDYLSTVSGGSLTGAYYCVADDREWNPGNLQRKLTYSYASDLIVGTVMPWNWVPLLVSDYDRTDILAASFGHELFTRGGRAMTYSNLRPDRPRLLINATDLQSGRRFVFCNESFNQINSDLSQYPLAYATAASAAVPAVLHPVTLRDYSTIFAQYRHLIDGGVTDNLGIETLVETYSAQLVAAKATKRADPYPRGAIFIVVDAHTQFDAELSSKSDVGLIQSLRTAVGLSSTELLNRASSAALADIIIHNSPDSATASELRKQIKQLSETGYLELKDRTGHLVRVVYLSLAQVNDLNDLPFRSFRESINSIATYFNISPVEAYHLYQAADLLVQQKFEPQLRDLARELDQPAK